MAYTYDEYDRSNWVYQPTMTRSRQRFRGPRESQKINQEIQQAFCDIGKLHSLHAEVKAVLDDYVEMIDSDQFTGFISGDLNIDVYNAVEDELVTLLLFYGTIVMWEVLNDMSYRIKRLESSKYWES